MQTALYLIFGDEYLVQDKAKKIVDDLVTPEDRTFGLEVIDGSADTVECAVSAVDSCITSLLTLGFLANRKVVWFRDVSFLGEAALSRSETVKSRLGELEIMIKEGLSVGQTLVISSSAIDKRYSFFKACKKVGELHEFAVPDKPHLAEDQARHRLRDALSSAGLKMQESVMLSFLGKVGTDTRQIVNEVNKLAVFIGSRKEVSLADLDVTCSTREAAGWDLADAFGKQDVARTLSTLRQLLFQKESPIALIIGLEKRVRDLMIFREALDQGWLTISSGYRGTATWGNVPERIENAFASGFTRDPRSMHPFRTKLLAEQAQAFSLRKLRKCLSDVTAAHVSLVSSSVPQSMVLELLLLKMLS
jgi:DNA polymerase-3 subunit delta